MCPVMPDHVHLLVKLGDRMSLGQSIKRLKAKTSACLASVGSTWERDFFDRQMREWDDERAVFLYIYLNPYRAGLSQRSERWPWYYCRPEDWAWFQAYLDRDLPPPEWLR